MYLYAMRDSYSWCITRKDWCPLQMLEHGAIAVVTFQHDGGPYCPVRFDYVE